MLVPRHANFVGNCHIILFQPSSNLVTTMKQPCAFETVTAMDLVVTRLLKDWRCYNHGLGCNNHAQHCLMHIYHYLYCYSVWLLHFSVENIRYNKSPTTAYINEHCQSQSDLIFSVMEHLTLTSVGSVSPLQCKITITTVFTVPRLAPICANSYIRLDWAISSTAIVCTI